MIFDTIYNFYYNLLTSSDNVSTWWSSYVFMDYDGNNLIYGYDYLSAIGTVITIVLGVVALFRILGGVLRLFKV